MFFSDPYYDCDGNCYVDENGDCYYLSNIIDSINENYISSLSSLQQALDTWNTTIDLSSGWNMFGYGCPTSIDLADGLSSHTDKITIVKDNNGNVYMPEFGFNGIGVLTPGYGYQIKVTEEINDFSLCDWYVNDIPEDNIVSLQDSLNLINSQIGCTDSLACNFSLFHLYDDGSCEFPEQGYDCFGNITEYFVGMEVNGGIVFWIDHTGEHGLVSAKQDLNSKIMWGCSGQNITGANGYALQDGLQNTLDIVAECFEDPIAASECLNYELNGYDDWYLPSHDELLQMYYELGNGSESGNVGEYKNDWYFSSTESSANEAKTIDFQNGFIHPSGAYKTSFGWVRPIRSF